MTSLTNSSVRRLADRLVDVTARRPTGPIGRRMYRQPAGHERSFRQVLQWLGPVEGDSCLEIGCGGGVLLERVLAAGAASVAGLDHSLDMLALSMARNARGARHRPADPKTRRRVGHPLDRGVLRRGLHRERVRPRRRPARADRPGHRPPRSRPRAINTARGEQPGKAGRSRRCGPPGM
jgi:SAM-dependent methyltransferase